MDKEKDIIETSKIFETQKGYIKTKLDCLEYDSFYNGIEPKWFIESIEEWLQELKENVNETEN